ncbi:MAG TPA: hypothetical protein VGF99_15065 [Myxococcota bacterium]
MSNAQRDPNTAAAIVLLLGVLAELESGDAVAIKVTSDDDNDDGRWRIAVDLAAPVAGERGDDDVVAHGAGAVERVAPHERERCPLCTKLTFDTATKACTNCDFRDG